MKAFIEKYKITFALGVGGVLIIGSTFGSCQFTPGETVEAVEAPVEAPAAEVAEPVKPAPVVAD